jgi:predicted pyridoxine 5'-phosphate oxidase superfamily flavin-nucleotide-binding protein
MSDTAIILHGTSLPGAASVFHPGERAAQALGGGGPRTAPIGNTMPDQHRLFFAQLPFLLAATTDAAGWPVATILSGAPGFVSSPDPATLTIAAGPDAGDPTGAHLVPGAEIGLLGLDFAARRRNRTNGVIGSDEAHGLRVAVRQSFGNCPKYIRPRQWETASRTPGAVEHLAGLDREARRRIADADTFFLATASGGGAGPQGGADISHRGGPAGFVRLIGDVLEVPDFRGNRYFNSFGNLLLDPRAALLFLDFATGTVLHLQGHADIVWKPVADMAGAERMLRIHVVSAWRRPRAVSLRWHDLA